MPTILAMGGGGFSMEPRNLLLDSYLLSLSRSRRPRVAFLPTASGDAAGYIDRFLRSFARHRCRPSVISLFDLPHGSLLARVLDQDVVYVGGGHTRNMLVLWREHGLDQILLSAWRQGTVLGGISAGSICWFEEGLSDAVVPGALRPLPCLGLLPGSNCPHYDGETRRRPTYRRLIASGAMVPGWAADDGAALEFQGKDLRCAVASRKRARAWRVERKERRAVETEIIPTFLGRQ